MGKFLKFFGSTTLLSIFLFTLACLANAATFTVDTTDDTEDAQPGNGACADNTGDCSLRAAIQETNALSGADVINLPAGTYALTLPSALPDISGDLTINGAGFDSTIIDAIGQYRVFSIGYRNPLYQVAISGVTITGGSAPDNLYIGGGIYNRGNLTITDSLIDNNKAGANGAGGGIANYDGILTITNSTVSNNSIGEPWTQVQGYGGGIINYNTLTIINSTIKLNVSHAGGGIFHQNGALSIINSTIRNNYATQISQIGNGNGGGIFANIGSVDINGSTINNNKAYYGGSVWPCASGIYNTNTTMTITNSTISGNGDTPLTGGIVNANNTLTISNSTISNNNDNNSYGPPTGGIRQVDGTVSLFNTIVANQAGGADCSGTIKSNGYNLDSDGTCGLAEETDISEGYAELGPLADNGGPTLTHALLPGSQAIDAGDNTACLSVDQRGVKRPQGAACDIGAYESIPYWEQKGSIPGERYSHSACVLDNKLYVFGGEYISFFAPRDTLQRYNPDTDAWDDVLSMIYDHDLGGCGVVDGKAYVMGGRMVEEYGLQQLTLIPHNIIERYSPLAHSWLEMNTALYYPMYGFATATVNNKIYVMGGIGDYGYLNIVTEYDPGTGILTVKSPMPTARAYCSASVVGGKIYVFGGYTETGTFLNTVEIYDPSTDHWSTGTNMTVGRRSLASAAYGKYIYLFGGINNEGKLSLVEEYDTITKNWTNCQGVCPSMPEARYGHTATTFNGKIHIVGGVSISSNHIVFTPPIRIKSMPWIPLLLLED